MGCGRARLFQFSGIQRRRFRRGAGRDALRRIPHPGALSRRLHDAGAGSALCAGVLSGCLFAGRCGAPLPAQQRRLEPVSRESRHSAERHAPGDGGSRTHAHSAGRSPSRMGRSLGHHAEARWRIRTTRCCPKLWRNGRWRGSRSCCPAIWKSSTRSIAGCSTTFGAGFPATKDAFSA